MGNANMDVFGQLKFKQTRKKRYDVYMCMPARGTNVINKLEGAQYETSDNKPFVLSGTVGEKWVIDANKLAKTYTFADGSPITPETLQTRLKNGIIDWVRLTTKQAGVDINFAAHLPLSVTNYPVQTSWGDVLYANRDGIPHGKGDFIVCASINGQPNLNDVWVVNGEVFPTTYDMRAFPGFGSGTAKDTPVPKSITGQESPRIKIGNYVVQKLKKYSIYLENICANDDNDDSTIYLTGNNFNVMINMLGDNTYEVIVATDTVNTDWNVLGSKRVVGPDSIVKAVVEMLKNHKKGKKYITDYIVGGLRQRGDRVGKILDKDDFNVSFTVNNGTYGVILFINEGDPAEGSNSISLMYHNNNNWDEAATWFIDDYGIDESINRLHAMINGATNLDGIISKVNKHMPGAIHDEYAFESYTRDNNKELEKPAYFKQLLKTYEYVKGKLQLRANGELITKTEEEPLHWRIDFESGIYPEAILFIDIWENEIIPCVQLNNGDYHDESCFATTTDGYKQTFQWIGRHLVDFKKGVF